MEHAIRMVKRNKTWTSTIHTYLTQKAKKKNKTKTTRTPTENSVINSGASNKSAILAPVVTPVELTI